MFGVSSSLIRYWESEFATLKPKKNRKGDRRFVKKDILLLEKIYTLVKERGFTLDGAKKELRKKGPVIKNQELILKLKNIKSGLKDLRDKI